MNPLLIHDDSPYMLMNFAEVEFLQAEAIERGIGTVPGTADSSLQCRCKSCNADVHYF